MKVCSALLALLLYTTGCLCEEYQVNYSNHLSLYYPYIDSQGFCEFGTIYGDAMVIAKGQNFGISLTSRKKDSMGHVSARKHNPMSNWRVDVSLKISPGAEGISVWFTEEEIKEGKIFGGSSAKGVLVFLNMKNEKIQPSSVGLSRRGNRIDTVFIKKVPVHELCTIRVEYFNGAIKVFYGENLATLHEIGSTSQVYIPKKHLIGVSGSSPSGEGDVIVKSIFISKITIPKQKKESIEDESGNRGFLVIWVVFILLIGGVGYYLYVQKRIPKKSNNTIRY